MEWRKILLSSFAMLGVYLVAAGGVNPLLNGQEASTLLTPLSKASSFDLGLIIVSMLMLFWAAILGPRSKGFTRRELLQGIAFGCAIIGSGCLALGYYSAVQQSSLQLSGACLLLGMLQLTIGLAAGLLLQAREGNIRQSLTPIVVNASLLGLLMSCVLIPA